MAYTSSLKNHISEKEKNDNKPKINPEETQLGSGIAIANELNGNRRYMLEAENVQNLCHTVTH